MTVLVIPACLYLSGSIAILALVSRHTSTTHMLEKLRSGAVEKKSFPTQRAYGLPHATIPTTRGMLNRSLSASDMHQRHSVTSPPR